MRDLIYTIAFDAPGQLWHHVMAKFLVSSIFRTGFRGDVLILTNSDHRVFEYKRDRVTEFCFNTSNVRNEQLGLEAQKFKYGAREFFPRKKYRNVMFVDSDCLFNHAPESLMQTDVDIGFAHEAFTTLDKHP